jgi:protein-tyrosine phosphatase
MGFVDLHSHVLYGVDDGAPDPATSLALLDGLAALGITEQCVTPHQKAGQYLPAWDRVEAALAGVERLRRPEHPTLRLGAENMWDDVFIRRLASDEIPRYRDTLAFLVEIPPPLMPPGMIDHLFKLRIKRMVPVLAHPERYQRLRGRPRRGRRVSRPPRGQGRAPPARDRPRLRRRQRRAPGR